MAKLKDIVRRKEALLTGAARPGRVTELIPDGSGGFARRLVDPEAWLFKNRKALASVKQGLKESAKGKGIYRGSFAKYADEPTAPLTS
jgi:hypothetical protein